MKCYISLILLLLLALPPNTSAQTTVTNCQASGNRIGCTSRTVQPVTVNANAFSDALRNERKRRQENKLIEEQIELARLAAENTRLTNVLMSQQIEANEGHRVIAEVSTLKAAWDRLLAIESQLPKSDRIPTHLLSRIAINEVTQATGVSPLERSVEVFRRQIGVQ
jgi:cell shape-determining protein MreC